MSETTPQAKWDLFIASFLALFLEVMFIRWVPSYERVLAYFTNFVLIAAFLGLGLGSMLARWRRDLIRWQPLLVLLLVCVGIFFNRYVKTWGVAEDVFYSEFGRRTLLELKLPYTLMLFFVLVAVGFVPLGQCVGKGFMAVTPTLSGYVLNLLGSLLGVAGFALVSFLHLPPVWWFAVGMALLLWFVRRHPIWLGVNALLAVVTGLAVYYAGTGFVWSPYHKLVTSPLVVDRATGMLWPYKQGMDPQRAAVLPEQSGFHIAVDDDFLQMALDLSDRSTSSNPFLQHYRAQYDLAYRIPNFPYKDILIVGAGTGNDTAAALRHGAEHVDAVEIDPALVQLGRQRHPERPYHDPRVRVIVDDARSFFNKTDRKYDLVVFGLLDSHRLFSSMSSVRLDSFVFTVDSFRDVRRVLKDNGVAVVEHGLGTPFMGTRMYVMLREAFEMPPHVIRIPEFPGLTYIIGPGVSKYLPAPPSLDAGKVIPATDDWPFFYLEGRKLPREYRVALLAMFVVSLLAVVGFSKGKVRTLDLHFFFLGSAFLLIETLSVTRFAMLFGSTWVVNSIVFAAILAVVLMANLWMQRIESVDRRWLYVMLAGAVLLNFWFPIQVLLRVGLAWRLLVAMALMGAPIFFAAFIFARSFKETQNPDLAYASNILGAVVGGLAEYSTLVVGFRYQLLIALAMYALSAVALYWATRKAAVTA